jgi:hypothetical protein
MTPNKILDIGLRRAGLTASSSDFKDNAREYFNLTAKDITGRVQWSWMFQDASFTTSDGTRTYSLASDVLEPLSFRDETEDRSLKISSALDTDIFDPDEDESGEAQLVILKNLNSSTGYWDVDIYPTPDSVNTISYRYYRFIPDLNAEGGDDNTDLAPKFPAWVQPALIYGISGLYLSELGSVDSANMEFRLMESVMDQALERNARAFVPESRMSANGNQPFAFSVQAGSLS